MPVTSNINRLHLTLTGTSGLVLNNIRGADPDEPLVQLIKEITDRKSHMTAEDRKRLELLKWRCSLYPQDADGNFTFPVASVLRSFQAAATTFRKGKTLQQAVSPTSTDTIIQYDGPRTLETLYADDRFRLRNMVNTNPTGKKAMVPTVRPIFPEWVVELDVLLINEILGLAEFTRIVELAGAGEGIGNARRLGYGRFSAEIKEV